MHRVHCARAAATERERTRARCRGNRDNVKSRGSNSVEFLCRRTSEKRVRAHAYVHTHARMSGPCMCARSCKERRDNGREGTGPSERAAFSRVCKKMTDVGQLTETSLMVVHIVAVRVSEDYRTVEFKEIETKCIFETRRQSARIFYGVSLVIEV